MKLSLLTALVAITLSACTVSKSHAPTNQYGQGIIGGTAVTATEPIGTMTAMLIDVKQGALCTASILNTEWLLTAAHCVNDADASSLVVAFSGSFQDIASGHASKKDLRKVQGFVVNPKYAETMQKIEDMEAAAKAEGREISMSDLDDSKDWGDLALVHIAGKIPAGKIPATLMPMTNALKKLDTVTLAGYGQEGSDENSDYGSLNKVDVQIYEPAWGSTEVVIDQTSGKGACHGDSGGPAYAQVDGQLYLFGVTSRGMGDGDGPQCTHYSVYTNASTYTTWITATIGQ